MTLAAAMFTGVAGMNAFSQQLGYSSENIANARSTGYKRNFSHMISQVTASTRTFNNPGGVRSYGYQVFRQGLLEGTTNETDMAISGGGFFVVSQSSNIGAGQELLYTRAGAFTPDQSGFLRNAAGFYLQAWQLDPITGALPSGFGSTSSLSSVNISNIVGEPVETTLASIGANLPADAAVSDVSTRDITIVDTLGQTHTIRLNFTKTAANTWRMSLSVTDGAIAGVEDNTDVDSTNTLDGTGANYITLTFNSDGTPSTAVDGISTNSSLDATSGQIDLVFDFSSVGASATQAISLDLGTFGALGTAESNGLTQFSGNDSTNFINANGKEPGAFISLGILEDGTMRAFFDNGETRDLYRVPLAAFPNAEGLTKVTGNAWKQSITSGASFLNQANGGGVGTIVSSSLESSNVDLAEEFSLIIIIQRAFSANARVINAASELFQELLQIG